MCARIRQPGESEAEPGGRRSPGGLERKSGSEREWSLHLLSLHNSFFRPDTPPLRASPCRSRYAPRAASTRTPVTLSWAWLGRACVRPPARGARAEGREEERRREGGSGGGGGGGVPLCLPAQGRRLGPSPLLPPGWVGARPNPVRVVRATADLCAGRPAGGPKAQHALALADRSPRLGGLLPRHTRRLCAAPARPPLMCALCMAIYLPYLPQGGEAGCGAGTGPGRAARRP